MCSARAWLFEKFNGHGSNRVFETHNPICRPVNHLPTASLMYFWEMPYFFQFLRVRIEIIKDMLVTTHRKTIARRVANIFANLCPIFGNAIFAFFIIKKRSIRRKSQYPNQDKAHPPQDRREDIECNFSE